MPWRRIKIRSRGAQKTPVRKKTTHKPSQEIFLLLCSAQVPALCHQGAVTAFGCRKSLAFLQTMEKASRVFVGRRLQDTRSQDRFSSNQRSEEHIPNSIGVNRNPAPIQALEAVKLHQKLALQPGPGARKGDISNLKCTNKGVRTPLPIGKSLWCLWRNTMRGIQKSTHCTLELLLLFVLLRRNHQEKKESHDCQSEVPKGSLTKHLSGAA